MACSSRIARPEGVWRSWGSGFLAKEDGEVGVAVSADFRGVGYSVIEGMVCVSLGRKWWCSAPNVWVWQS